MNMGKKGNIINQLPTIFRIENDVNEKRVHELNRYPVFDGDVLYVMERELRTADNFSLNFALQLAKKYKKNLKIVHPYKKIQNIDKKNFYDNELEILKQDMKKSKLSFRVLYRNIKVSMQKVEPGIVVIDFDPLRADNFYDFFTCKIFEVDSHNIVPARYISDKQEYSALQMRTLIYDTIYEFFTELPYTLKSNSKGLGVLKDFIENNLNCYALEKNNPEKQCTSNLSRYITFGFVSSQRIALEVYKSLQSHENIEAFLEELIVRKELADNYCLYNKNYKSIKGAPDLAVTSLNEHINDFRFIQYSPKELEFAKTKDIIWNAAQKELTQTGKIHGYIRMYWAKKLLEWTETPQEALDIAIYLNDKYAFDAPSPNGYVGILWAIAGLHDRPFTDRPISGKIRMMSYQKLMSRLSGGNYLSGFSNLR